MRKLLIVNAIVIGFCLGQAGCGWFSSNRPEISGGVAVIDLDEIAREVGATDEMSQAIAAHEAALNAQLHTLKANYVEQLQSKKNELGSEPTTEDNQRFAAMSQQASLNLAAAQQQAKGHMTKHRADLVIQFRKRVAPIAQQIAAERGLSLVIPRNEGMILAVDEQIDITDAVAAALKPQWQTLATPSSGATVPTQPPAQMATGDSQSEVQPAGYSAP